MVFALYSKVVQNLAAAVEFVHSIIKTLNCCVVLSGTGWYLMLLGDTWWYKEIFGGTWGYLVVLVCTQWYLVVIYSIFFTLWYFVVIYLNLLQFIVIFGILYHTMALCIFVFLAAYLTSGQDLVNMVYEVEFT